MKRSGFREKTKEEKLAKLAEKRAKAIESRKQTKKRPKVVKQANKKKSKPKSQSLAKLKKELDRVFSLYIRYKYADQNGNLTCYTCNKPGTPKTVHAGHYVSRQYLATRWSEDNVRPQCPGCNLFGNGKPLDFEERLKKDLGEKRVEEMKQSRHQVVKLDRQWYEEQIAYYKDLHQKQLMV